MIGRKRAVIALVERAGEVRSIHRSCCDGGNSRGHRAREHCDARARLHTDESKLYRVVGRDFAAHETVNHAKKEYVRGDVTQTRLKATFSIFKRGMRGVYQHCDEKHLHRYLAEYDFRYNHRTALGFNDGERAALAIKSADGKRLTYRGTNEARV